MSGHQGFVLATCFSGDGSRLYSASIEGDVGVWDLPQGERVESWVCHEGPVNALAWDGELISGGFDGSVGIWNAADGSLIHRLVGHTGGVMGLAVLGDIVASASADHRIGIWDRHSGELIHFIEGHDEAVTCVAFLDADTLVSGSRDCSVRVWSIRSRTLIRKFDGHRWWVTKVGALRDRRIVSVSEDCSLRVWNVAAGEADWVFDGCPGPIWGMGIEPGGVRVVIGYGGKTLRVNLIDHTCQELPDEAPVSSRAISVSPHGDCLALGQDHGEIHLLNLSEPALIGVYRGAGARIISGIVDAGLTVQGRIGGDLHVCTSAGDVALKDAHGFFVYAMRRLSKTRFVTGAFDNKVRVWEAGLEVPIAEFDHGGLVFSLVARDDGRQVLSAGWDRLALWNVDSGGPLWKVRDAGVGAHIVAAISEPSDQVATVGEAPIVKLWRLADGAAMASWPLPDSHSCAIEAVPGEDLVVVGSAFGRVSLVALSSGASTPLHGEHEDWIRIIRVSPDGQRVASVGQNGTGRVFDRASNQVSSRFDAMPVVVVDFDESGALHWMDALGGVHRE